MGKIAVIHFDDDLAILDSVRSVLQETSDVSIEHFSVKSVNTIAAYVQELEAVTFDVAIIDIAADSEDYVTQGLVARTRELQPASKIFVYSGLTDSSYVRQSLKQGADDFIAKGPAVEEIRQRILNSFQSETVVANTDEGAAFPTSSLPHVVGRTMQTVVARVPQILKSAVTSVHVFGETGVGKEVVAEIFEQMISDNIPFVKINCGAITPSLMESELFGHVKGAFTGANADRVGLIEKSNGGWIFMDEVATLSQQAQVSLLRVLENGTLRRVGDTKEINVKIRLISATNEVIPELIRLGKFRDDLWQRLCEIRLDIPPLRERKDEIPALIAHFCMSMDGGPYEVEQTVISALSHFPWSYGNVRELRNSLRAMTERRIGKVLTTLSVPSRLWESLDNIDTKARGDGENVQQENLEDHSLKIAWPGEKMPDFSVLTEILLLEALKKIFAQQGKLSVSELSRQLGVSRTTLSARLHNVVDAGHISAEAMAEMVSLGAMKGAG